jgi:hypothetical protein
MAEADAPPEPFATAILLAKAAPLSPEMSAVPPPVAVANDAASPEPFAVARLVAEALPPFASPTINAPCPEFPPVAAAVETALLDPFDRTLLVAVAPPPFPPKPSIPPAE